MADGSTKPIAEVEIGDKVKATDPTTGETTDRDVVATIVHADEDDMTRLTITAGDGTIDATYWHPVWIAAEGRFVNIGDLKPGQQLTSIGSTSPQVTDSIATPTLSLSTTSPSRAATRTTHARGQCRSSCTTVVLVIHSTRHVRRETASPGRSPIPPGRQCAPLSSTPRRRSPCWRRATSVRASFCFAGRAGAAATAATRGIGVLGHLRPADPTALGFRTSLLLRHGAIGAHD
nr:Hint domain-containing protein [Saccharothrix sp. NRRL B-16348]